MKTAFLVLVGLVFAAFVAANWPAFTTSTVLTLGVIDIVAPLGLVMLFALAAVALLFSGILLVWQARTLGEWRRQSREVSAHRALAEAAESSRLTTLHDAMAEHLKRVELRVEAAEIALRGELHDGMNSLAAMVGEMDDRLASDDSSTRTLNTTQRH